LVWGPSWRWLGETSTVHPPDVIPESNALRLHGLPPAIGRQTQQLMLGTFLGATSLARQQYYALPQNAFWKVFQAILPSSPYTIRADSY
jgi:hypothetical protein